MPFVLDASVTLAWCFRDEQTPYSLAVLDRLDNEDGIVPSLWAMEVANGLLFAERRGRLTLAETREILASLAGLSLSLQETSRGYVLGRLFDLARSENLTVYDAAYLDLAMREGLPLASQDTELRRAAETARRRAGLAKVQPVL